jgi:hypothetical protein
MTGAHPTTDTTDPSGTGHPGGARTIVPLFSADTDLPRAALRMLADLTACQSCP